MWGDLNRLKRLESRVDDLEREIKKLELEFSDLYDKVRTMVAKWAKRIGRAQSEEEESEREAESEGIIESASTSLTPQQQRIQQQILARRGVKTNAVLPR